MVKFGRSSLGTLVIFNAWTYRDENSKTMADKHNFLTRVRITDSDQKYIDPGRWLRVDDDTHAYMYRGSNHRCKIIFSLRNGTMN